MLRTQMENNVLFKVNMEITCHEKNLQEENEKIISVIIKVILQVAMPITCKYKRNLKFNNHSYLLFIFTDRKAELVIYI